MLAALAPARQANGQLVLPLLLLGGLGIITGGWYADCLEPYQERFRDQLRAQQMKLEVTEAAKQHIIKLGYDVAYGARPLRRVIQNMVEDVLAEHLLLGKYEPGTTIVVDKDQDSGLDIHAAVEEKTPVETH